MHGPIVMGDGSKGAGHAIAGGELLTLGHE